MSDVFDRYELKLTISSIYVILGYVQLEIMALKGGLFYSINLLLNRQDLL